jgi:hypothetical protein
MPRTSVLAFSVLAAMVLDVRGASAGTVSFAGSSGAFAASATLVSGGDILTSTSTDTATIPAPNNGSLSGNAFWNSDISGSEGTTAYLSTAANGSGSAPISGGTLLSNFGAYGSGAEAGNFSSCAPTNSVPVPAAVWAGGSMLALLGLRRVVRKL